MAPASFAALHVGHGPELTLLEYLYLVLRYLLAFGGTAVLVYWGSGAVDAIRSAYSARPGGEEDEPERWRTS